MQTARTPQAAGRGLRKLLSLAPLLLLVGCQSRAGTGALVGGGAGALLGNAVAKATGGSRTAGTAIGGMIGAVGGAIAGDSVDQTEKRAEARGQAMAMAQRNAQRAPTIPDIVQMSRGGLTDAVIINQIRTTGATYPNLSSQDVTFMHQEGVSSAVIAEMQGAPQQRVYTAQPVTLVRPAPVYVEEPPPVRAGFYYRSR